MKEYICSIRSYLTCYDFEILPSYLTDFPPFFPQIYLSSLNPVWTVDTRSLFLVSCTAEDFFGHVAGLTFHVVDQDPVSKGAVVAHVSVPHTKLLQMDGERESFRLDVTPAFKKKKKNLGRYYKPKLHLRVRSADQDDLQFMKLLTSIRCSKKEGVHADHCFIAPQKERVGLLRRETKVVDGVTLVSDF